MAEERFHIAEWFGQPFHRLNDTERLRFANHKGAGAAMTKADTKRLQHLEHQAQSGELNTRESARLSALRDKLAKQEANELPCPFRTDRPNATCTKPGGVCSIRVYGEFLGKIEPVSGDKGRVRALCPWRFHQNNIAFNAVGAGLLDDPAPIKAGEVGFLKSTGTLDSEPGEDVGRIDMILVNSNDPLLRSMRWAAAEVQAVYFSGKNMAIEFKHIIATKGRLSMPLEKRRPDYRSSGVKRLMPQLQTKVPTLRRWGKKMAVIVDAPFFQSMGQMNSVPHISNADIAWFIVDFIEDPLSDLLKLSVVREVYTTLESATEGLTGGVPLSENEFEARIRAKLVE